MRSLLVDAALDEVRVDGACLHRRDGTVCAVVRSGDLDVPALDVSRRTAAVAAFARLCRTLDGCLQILVQVRRWHDHPEFMSPTTETDDPAAPTLAQTLGDAASAHRRRVLAARPAFRRTILFVPSAGSIDDLERAARLVMDTLRAAGTTAHRLRDTGLRALVREAWGDSAAPDNAGLDSAAPHGAAPDTATPATPWMHPPSWTRHPTHAVLGTLLVRAVVLRRLPGVAVEPGWMAPLFDVRAECDISLQITPVGVADAMSAIGRRLRTLRADQLVELDRESFGDAGLEVGVDSALDLRGRLARNEGRAARLGLVAVARAHDPAALDLAADALRTATGATLAHCEPAHLQHLEAAATAWPLGHDLLGAAKLVDSTALATCLPWAASVCDDPGGYALGRATATGEPVRVAPFDTAQHGNANVAVIAASGQGKSYAIGTLVLEAAARGVGSVIIDPEGEYERIVRALGGDYVSIAPGCGTALNIFDVGADGRGETVAAVVELVGVLCGGALDEVERAHVDAAAMQAIQRAAREHRVPVLGDCLDALDSSASRAAPVLRRFCSGPLGELFNRPTAARLDAPVVGVSLRDLKSELVPAATLVVAEWLWSLVRRDRRERHVVFDEVGLLCAHPPLRTLLVQLARRCRKYRASLVVATQNAGDLLATPEGTVVATNPAIVLLGGHRGAETALMEEAFSLTPPQRRALEAARRGDFLLLAGSRRLPIHIDVSPLHHALLTGQPMPARPTGAG